MPYELLDQEDYIEVRLWGDVTKWEIIKAIGAVRIATPRKDRPDVWVLAEEVFIPFPDYGVIVDKALGWIPLRLKGARSALVVADAMQYELARVYCDELRFCPYEVAVFHSKEEALQWVFEKPEAKPSC